MAEPVYRVNQSIRQQIEIEAQLAGTHIDDLLILSKQIQEQGREVGFAQYAGNESVARAEATGAAAVREQNDAARRRSERERNAECSAERRTVCRYVDRQLAR